MLDSLYSRIMPCGYTDINWFTAKTKIIFFTPLPFLLPCRLPEPMTSMMGQWTMRKKHPRDWRCLGFYVHTHKYIYIYICILYIVRYMLLITVHFSTSLCLNIFTHYPFLLGTRDFTWTMLRTLPQHKTEANLVTIRFSHVQGIEVIRVFERPKRNSGIRWTLISSLQTKTKSVGTMRKLSLFETVNRHYPPRSSSSWETRNPQLFKI